MYKYFELFKMYWQNSWAYPVSFLMWRLRQFISTFSAITVWLVIFQNQSQTFGYTKEAMISYIFLIGFLQSMILATQMGSLASQIYTGEISNWFVRPQNVFLTLLTQELADKLQNFFCVIVETTLLFFIFLPVVVFPSAPIFFLFLLATLLGAVLFFIIMLLFGTIGFWSSDTWGTRFLFYMFIDFTAGKFFPLNILPSFLQTLFLLTPFPYFSYVQTQIFLGHLSPFESMKIIGIIVAWIVVAWSAFLFFWNKGIREYGAVGR